MPRLHVFADESGCFNFSRGNNITKYYIVCTVTMSSCDVGTRLLELRRKLAWNGAPLGDYFHAAEDRQQIRDEVFTVLAKEDFKIQATIMEKSKAMPKIRPTEHRFYKHGWFYHFQYSMNYHLRAADEVMITVASIGTKNKRVQFEDAVRDVVTQRNIKKNWTVSFWPCQTDPCLQAADYCTWALRRKWELNDLRSYDQIKSKITYEYDLFEKGTIHYY